MHDIYIYGVIDQDNNSMLSLQNQIHKAPKDTKELRIHIRSEGGDVSEGLGIYDILRSTDKKIITVAEGIVASIASIIFLAGEEREIMQNAQVMIHNPWTFGQGNASELEMQAGNLRSIERRLASIYSERTGTDQNTIIDLMANETYIDAEQAIEMKFATTITQPFKAVAYLSKNNINMNEIEKSVNDKLDSFWVKLSKAMGFEKTKCLIITAADGSILDFGDSVVEATDIEIGQDAKIEDAPAVGTFLMPDGRTFIFEAGKLTEIIKVIPDELKVISEENALLIASNEALKVENAEIRASLEVLKSEFTSIRAQIKTDIKGFDKKTKPVVAKESTNRFSNFSL